MAGADGESGFTPGRGLVVLAGSAIGVAVYIGIATALGIAPLYAGFLFAFYFGGIQRGAPRAYPAALIGMLGGLLTAALLHILPGLFGTAGLVVPLLAIVLAVYALLLGWAPTLVNNGFMLMLTIGTIPAVQREAAFAGMACAILLVAAMMGALLLAGGMLARRRSAARGG